MSGLGSGLKRLPSRLFVRTGAEVSLHLSISTWQRRPIEDHVHASDTKRCTAEISVNDRPADATGALMSIVKRHLAEHEERLVLIEEICIDTGALILDVATDDVYLRLFVGEGGELAPRDPATFASAIRKLADEPELANIRARLV